MKKNLLCFVFLYRSSFDSILMELVTAVNSVKYKSISSERLQTTRFRLEAVGWFLLTLALAIFIPDIVVVMRPLGGLASMFMLTFPGNSSYLSYFCIYSVISGLCLLNLLLHNLVQITSQLLRLSLYIVAITYTALGCYILGSSVTYSVMSESHAFS